MSTKAKRSRKYVTTLTITQKDGHITLQLGFSPSVAPTDNTQYTHQLGIFALKCVKDKLLRDNAESDSE